MESLQSRKVGFVEMAKLLARITNEEERRFCRYEMTSLDSSH